MRLLGLLCAAAPLLAAVPGVPEGGPTGGLPRLILTTSNDLLGNGMGNGDDFRTAGVGGHARYGPAVVSVEAAMLTDREGGHRADQIVALAGAWFGPAAPRLGWHAAGFLGAGVQLDGHLGGEGLQNWVHRAINTDTVHLAYDPDPDPDRRPLLGASALGGWLAAIPTATGLTGWWGVQLLASGSAVLAGEQILEVGPRLVLVGQEGAFWLGARLRSQRDAGTGATVDATLDHEAGWWIEAGTYVTPLTCAGGCALGWQVRSAFNPETRATLGSLGLLYQTGAGPTGASLDLQHDLAVYDGGGVGIQLRWLPFPYQQRRLSSLVLDYRFGTNPDGRLDWDNGPGGTAGAELRHDQVSLGWEEGVRSPAWSGVRFGAALQAAIGVRAEGVLAQGSGAREVQGQATTGVFRASGLARIEFGEMLSLGISLDGWRPWWRESLYDQAGGEVVLNAARWTTGLHLAAHVAW